ncbi:MAG TPA: glutathione S-transferase N-terminal domain-containing protein [Candidatus Thermoplasmatota archaeon]|nr:glutathione S-transferase N-terminal domain-containing protein [Candidatus Thermoplasmatota archaeon]
MIPTGITLYQWQHCPYCTKVRRAFDQMGLQYRIVECGPDQAEVYQLLGRRQVPAIKDVRTGVTMLESDDIIAYARRQYGEGGGAQQGDGAPSEAA